MALQVHSAAYGQGWRPLFWIALSFVVYIACLWWLFPGYVRPLIPHHPDLYLPNGLLNRSVAEVLTFPRPLSQVFLQGIGLLGVSGSIAAVIALVLAGAAATAMLVQHLSQVIPTGLAFTVYAALLFAHPQFYFQHRHDVPAALTYLLLLALAAAVWHRASYLLVGTLALTLALSKETYYASALLLVVALGGGRRWRLAALVAGIQAGALLYNVARYKHFLGQAATGTQTYAPSLHPLALVSNFWFFTRELLWPWGWLVLLICCCMLWLQRDRLWLSLVLVCAGLAAFLPHSALPHHLERQYAWVAAPLVFAPVLLVGGKWWRQGVIVAAAVLSISMNNYGTEELQWLVQQEQTGERIFASLYRLDRLDARQVLVTGLRAPFHPWLAPDYIQHRFGRAQRWTVLVPRGAPRRTDRNVELALPREARWKDADAVAVYDADGSLRQVTRAANVEEAALVPGLSALTAKPEDFNSMLAAGVELLQWGWPERAEEYLNRAIELGAANPYGYFFLGRAREQMGDAAAAKKLYERAVALDAEPRNPAFREALRNAPS